MPSGCGPGEEDLNKLQFFFFLAPSLAKCLSTPECDPSFEQINKALKPDWEKSCIRFRFGSDEITRGPLATLLT